MSATKEFINKKTVLGSALKGEGNDLMWKYDKIVREGVCQNRDNATEIVSSIDSVNSVG